MEDFPVLKALPAEGKRSPQRTKRERSRSVHEEIVKL